MKSTTRVVWTWAAAAVASAAVAACGGNKADSAAVDGPECRDNPPLDWDNFGKGHMDKHCNGCHSVLIPEYQRQGAPAGVDFNTYGDVLAWRERIVARGTRAVLDEPTMPPGGGPSDEELSNVLEWLDCEVAKDKTALSRGR
ncbi:MAG: hypothetical protein CL927_18585 [Deltaproteobacteria bacterium]|nr:hypothetical protein [Deltaproteobacteria bacterium]HCH62581.1 hypothetical protein [Deltaproteobacteria bacterium]